MKNRLTSQRLEEVELALRKSGLLQSGANLALAPLKDNEDVLLQQFKRRGHSLSVSRFVSGTLVLMVRSTNSEPTNLALVCMMGVEWRLRVPADFVFRSTAELKLLWNALPDRSKENMALFSQKSAMLALEAFCTSFAALPAS
jgi:glucokinase